jgi:hypothetical protein
VVVAAAAMAQQGQTGSKRIEDGEMFEYICEEAVR